MNTTAHACYAFLIYNLIYWLWFGVYPPGVLCLFSVLFGIAPDLDYIYWKLVKKRDLDQTFQHHLIFWTHFPLSYIPAVIIFIISIFLNFFPEFFLSLVVGLYSHMVFDSMACGDGLQWARLPWRKTQYCRFVNLFADRVGTDGYHGGYYSARYRKTIFFKIENGAALFSIFLNIMYTFWSDQIISYIFLIVTFMVMMLIGLKKPDPKYLQEPPGGRYSDYRQNPEYIEYFRKKIETKETGTKD